MAKEELDELEKNTALATIDPLYQEMTSKYEDNVKIIDYLKAAKDDFITNLMIIKENKKERQEDSEIVQLL